MAPRLATITRRQEGILLSVSRSYNPPQGQLRDVATSVFCLQGPAGAELHGRCFCLGYEKWALFDQNKVLNQESWRGMAEMKIVDADSCYQIMPLIGQFMGNIVDRSPREQTGNLDDAFFQVLSIQIYTGWVFQWP